MASTLTGILASVGSMDASFHQPASALVASAQSDQPNKWTGGPWMRVSTGSNTVNSTGTDVLTGTGVTESAASRVRIGFQGIQAGVDSSGLLNVGSTGWNAHLGITGGQIQAGSTELLGPGTVDFSVPFVGLYGVLVKGNFFTDFMLRHDFLGLHATNGLAGLNNAGFNGATNNFNSFTGYHADLDNNWFLEPSVGISLTRTTLDGSHHHRRHHGVRHGEEHARPRAPLRGGTSINVQDKFALQPFAQLSVWHEFQDQASSTVTLAGTPIPLTVTRVGTFYQGSGGVTFQVLGTGFLGFMKGDVRWGENLSGWTAQGGARYTW